MFLPMLLPNISHILDDDHLENKALSTEYKHSGVTVQNIGQKERQFMNIY